MPTTVTVHEAKTKLSELLRRVEAGEEIIIARGDKPVATLKAITADDDIAARRRSAFGLFAGKYPPTPDSVFFDPMPEEELALWYDGPVFPEVPTPEIRPEIETAAKAKAKAKKARAGSK